MSTGDRVDGTDTYRIAVAVDDPDTVRQLMRTAVDVAADRDGEVLVVSVVVKAAESPVSLFTDEVIKREFGEEERELLDRGLDVAARRDVPVDGRLLVARDVAVAVREAVDEFDCDAVLVGWRERRRRGFAFGSNVDRIVRRVPCDVLVERIGATANGVERILLPAGEGPHAGLAADVARAVARANDAGVTVVRVVEPDADADRRASAEALVERTADDLTGVECETRVVAADDVTDALVAATDDHDLTAMGATEQGWLRRLLVGGVAHEVGRRSRSSVVLARRSGEAPSRVVRAVRDLLR